MHRARGVLRAAARLRHNVRPPVHRNMVPTLYRTQLHHEPYRSHSDSIACLLLTQDSQHDQRCIKSRSLNSPYLQSTVPANRPQSRRIVLSSRLNSGIEKRRSVSRCLCTSTGSESPASSTSKPASPLKRVTWKEALKSPAKAVRYVGQLRRDLVDWAKHIWAGAKLLAVRISALFP